MLCQEILQGTSNLKIACLERLKPLTKIMGKTAIWTIVFSSLLAPLNNVEEQRAKLASSNVIGSQHCVGGEGEF